MRLALIAAGALTLAGWALWLFSPSDPYPDPRWIRTEDNS